MLPALQPEEHGLPRRGQLQRPHHLLRPTEVGWKREGDHPPQHERHREVPPRPRLRRVLDQLQDRQPVRVCVNGRTDALVGHSATVGAHRLPPAVHGHKIEWTGVGWILSRIQLRSRSIQISGGHGARRGAHGQPQEQKAKQRHHGLRSGPWQAPRSHLLDPAQSRQFKVFPHDRGLDCSHLDGGSAHTHHDDQVPLLIPHLRLLVPHEGGSLLCHAHGRRRRHLGLLLQTKRSRVLP